MSTSVVIFIVIGAIVVLVALAAWLHDAKRSKQVAGDDERVEQP